MEIDDVACRHGKACTVDCTTNKTVKDLDYTNQMWNCSTFVLQVLETVGK